MEQSEIQKTEAEIYELTQKLAKLRKDAPRVEVKNYDFETLTGSTSLKDLFGQNDQLMVIHNMGQGCRYCTVWADGINPFLPHLESVISVVMVSKDSPELQRKMANERGWRFRSASHGGRDYLKEQSVGTAGSNYPGVVVYEKEGDKIFQKNKAVFGPFDEFCSLWNLLSLAGKNDTDFTPQFHYWKRPDKMEDGGENLN